MSEESQVGALVAVFKDLTQEVRAIGAEVKQTATLLTALTDRVNDAHIEQTRLQEHVSLIETTAASSGKLSLTTILGIITMGGLLVSGLFYTITSEVQQTADNRVIAARDATILAMQETHERELSQEIRLTELRLTLQSALAFSGKSPIR